LKRFSIAFSTSATCSAMSGHTNSVPPLGSAASTMILSGVADASAIFLAADEHGEVRRNVVGAEHAEVGVVEAQNAEEPVDLDVGDVLGEQAEARELAEDVVHQLHWRRSLVGRVRLRVERINAVARGETGRDEARTNGAEQLDLRVVARTRLGRQKQQHGNHTTANLDRHQRRQTWA
jgi:hypothetical protein